jgi:hypothetical protein
MLMESYQVFPMATEGEDTHPCLVVTQRRHRIQLRRPPGRNPAGEQRVLLSSTNTAENVRLPP